MAYLYLNFDYTYSDITLDNFDVKIETTNYFDPSS
jgi:hypothetical protein